MKYALILLLTVSAALGQSSQDGNWTFTNTGNVVTSAVEIDLVAHPENCEAYYGIYDSKSGRCVMTITFKPMDRDISCISERGIDTYAMKCSWYALEPTDDPIAALIEEKR